MGGHPSFAAALPREEENIPTPDVMVQVEKDMRVAAASGYAEMLDDGAVTAKLNIPMTADLQYLINQLKMIEKLKEECGEFSVVAERRRDKQEEENERAEKLADKMQDAMESRKSSGCAWKLNLVASSVQVNSGAIWLIMRVSIVKNMIHIC